ncbi:deoxyribose-phosphate aldolase [Muricauda oceani]|uniref:Deoxyribose-phosphate aldolase n=2 Tax=Flagellimonas oceani TaxID=2698672 RepID=A0A6G7J1R6_9FLAO|nr:deoxyribose-phosphate aldolase [Allomuricauda oceani]QII44745.1 deoxyribose-phosphate aldolase [Allomuricauda oceani]
MLDFTNKYPNHLMKRILIPLILVLTIGCKKEPKKVLTAQQIVDNSIADSGGKRFNDHKVTFDFRDKSYVSENVDGQRVYTRISEVDSMTITDVKRGDEFERYMNDSLVMVHDTMAVKYANSINSVHYFVRLPYGLNDGAVNKELLGKEIIENKEYYKVKVTFDQQGGGEDFEDTYLYWFDLKTFKPEYLAYDFHVDGGGQRFRKAYNERYVNGIRFVDYENYKPKNDGTGILQIGQLHNKGELELLSKIELKNIVVE